MGKVGHIGHRILLPSYLMWQVYLISRAIAAAPFVLEAAAALTALLAPVT